jgi:hypothetical protein
VSLIVTAMSGALLHMNLHVLGIQSSVSLLQFSLPFLVEECCSVNLQLQANPVPSKYISQHILKLLFLNITVSDITDMDSL